MFFFGGGGGGTGVYILPLILKSFLAQLVVKLNQFHNFSGAVKF